MVTRQKVIHIHSSVYENDKPKAPVSSQLEYGELAVNYNEFEPRIFLRDTSNSIREFSSDDIILKNAKLGDTYSVPITDNDDELTISSDDTVITSIGKLVKIIEDNEEIVASSLNDLNSTLNEITEVIDEIPSTINEINNRIDDVNDKFNSIPAPIISTNYQEHGYNEKLTATTISFNTVKQGDSMDSAIDKLETNLITIVDEMIKNEHTISNALNDVNDNIGKIYPEIDNINNQLVEIDDKINNVTLTIPDDYQVIEYRQPTASDIEFTSIAIGDDMSTAFNKVETNLSTLVNEVIENELVISEAFNVLNDRVNMLEDSNNNNISLSEGVFIDITNNVVDVKTGTTSTTIAVGNHTHSEFITSAATVANANKAVSATTAASAASVTWGNISDKPSNFKPSSHDHNDIYYTENEIDNILNGYSVTSHTHTTTTYESGHTVCTSLSSIPTTKRLVICTVSTNGSFSLANTPEDGKEIHVMVNNTGSSDIIITLPTSGYINLSGDVITVSSGKWVEINVLSDGTNKFLRAI